jgi:phosphate transport system permease protein
MATAETTQAARAVRPLSRGLTASRPRYGEKIILGLLFACAVVSIATTVGIVVSLVGPTVRFFREDVTVPAFLTGTQWSPLFANPQFGVLPLVSATLLITGIALLVAMPVGLLAAIYLSEYAPPKVRKVVKPVLEVLAGIPTVVFGFFALSFVTPILQQIWPLGNPPNIFNAASAGLVMGIMIVPTIASVSEDAMRAVPDALRAGSLAVGGTKLQTTIRVVLPAALSGIIAAFVLGISRAIGETMIVTIAAGGTPNLSWDPAEAMQTMTAFIAQAGIGDQPTGSVGYLTIFAVGSLLFAFTFVINIISLQLVRRFRQVY